MMAALLVLAFTENASKLVKHDPVITQAYSRCEDQGRLLDLQVRQLADLRTIGWPYHQRGLVATVRTEETNTTAHQRFLETGPLALLPVRDGYSNIVWSTTPTHAKQLESCSPSELAGEVNEVITLAASLRKQHISRFVEHSKRLN